MSSLRWHWFRSHASTYVFHFSVHRRPNLRPITPSLSQQMDKMQAYAASLACPVGAIRLKVPDPLMKKVLEIFPAEVCIYFATSFPLLSFLLFLSSYVGSCYSTAAFVLRSHLRFAIPISAVFLCFYISHRIFFFLSRLTPRISLG